MTVGHTLRVEHAREVDEILALYPKGREKSAVVGLLYLAQAAYGFLGAAAVEEVAEIVGVDPSHVRGVAGFYTLLRERPDGGYVLHVCTDLPCALRGADGLLAALCARLGVEPGGTSADGLFTVESVMCLAACDRAPVMQVNLEYYTDLDDSLLEQIIADLRARAVDGPPRRPPLGFGPPSEMAAAAPGGGGDGARHA